MTAIASRPSAGTTTTTTTTTTRTATLWKTVALATLVAAVATEVVVALANAIGPDVVLQGKAMPAGGCAIGVLMCMVPAVALLAALKRWAPRPARTWIRATVVLTALSVIPDLTVSGTPTGSRIALMTAHTVAAAIIVPAVARRLR
jgi:uncharacterized protein DUF6069